MNYPLLLDYQDTLFGRGFVAEITACGRLLATEDDGEWWIAGVNPGPLRLTVRRSMRLTPRFATPCRTS